MNVEPVTVTVPCAGAATTANWVAGPAGAVINPAVTGVPVVVTATTFWAWAIAADGTPVPRSDPRTAESDCQGSE